MSMAKSRFKAKTAAYHKQVHRLVVADEERLYQIILKPIVSEKSTMVADKNNQVVFRVRTDARKAEIRQAVEKLFDVKVQRVQIANVRGKTKMTGRIKGARSCWKKAYVCLYEGQDIDFLSMSGT